jgi:hypothetical protein
MLAERLGVTDRVAGKLIAGEHLKTVTVINPINRCPMVVVPAEEVERFERDFVSLFTLARHRRRHHMAVKKELDAAGVKPALKPEEVGATFYRRATVNKKMQVGA